MNAVHPNMPMRDYLDATGISKHSLDWFHRSPLDYIDYVSGRILEEQSEAMAIGTMVHSAVLENRQEWVVRPDTYPAETKSGTVQKPWTNAANYCSQWTAEQTKPILKQSQADEILEFIRLVRSDSLAGPLLAAGDAEISMFAEDHETGLQLKSRPDWTGSDYFIELKTTTDATTAAFSREIAQRRYHVQAAMNLIIASKLGLPQCRWIFIALQKGTPRINVRELDQDSIDLGKSIIRHELGRIAECRDAGVWPGYSGNTGKLEFISVPQWEHDKFGGETELLIGGGSFKV